MLQVNQSLKEYKFQMAGFARDLETLEIHASPKMIARLTCAAAYGWVHAIGGNNKSPHTIKNWFSMLRKTFEENTAELSVETRALFLGQFVMPAYILADVMDRATERRDEKATGQYTLTMEQVQQIMDAIDKVCATEPDDDYIEIVKRSYVASLAATGRRPIEVRTANFAVLEGHQDQSYEGSHAQVYFSGQAKTRRLEGLPEGYTIPVLGLSVDDLFYYLKDLDQGFAASVLKPIYEEIQDATDGAWPIDLAMTARTLRAFYACATYALFAPKGTQKWKWINEVLGHEDDDMSTCQTYNTFAITGGHGTDR